MESTDTPTTIETEEFQLTGWNEEFLPGNRPLLFGIMVNKAAKVTEHYISDLYWDAMWLNERLHDAGSFYWAARSWGCNMGTDPTLVGYGMDGTDQTFEMYRVDVFSRKGMWFARFTRIFDATTAEMLPDLPKKEASK